MSNLADQTSYLSADVIARLSTGTPPTPADLTKSTGSETVILNLTNNKDVIITNVASTKIDPPPYSAWNAAVTYAVGDVALYTDGNFYISIQAGVNENPQTATTFWARYPIQKFFDGESTYRNNTHLPVLSSSATNSTLQDSTVFTVAPSNSMAVFIPGGVPLGTAISTLAGVWVLSDEQAAIEPHSTPFLRSRIIFTRVASDGTPLLSVWYFCDAIKGISFGAQK